MLFPAIGFVLWIAFLIVAFVLFATIWGLSNVILRLLGLKPRLTGPQAAASPRRNQPPVPVPVQARPPQVEPDIWPKWTPSRRLYMDRELALWQQQFDALALHEPDVIMAAAIQRRGGTTSSV